VIYKLRIDRWQPALLNDLMGHWAKAHRLKAIDRKMVAGYCRINRIPLANGRREVRLTVTLAPSQRNAPDPDAFWKSTLDALVHADMLIDDCQEYCRMGGVTFEKGSDKSTLIELEEI
jgi:Holliday junction resolvase RusA-like endonuclease